MKTSLKAQEVRLAYMMLLPPLLIVALIVIFPVVANFWISFKPVELADLRAPAPVARERVSLNEADGTVGVQYRVRNSSTRSAIDDVTMTDVLPAGFRLSEGADGCRLDGELLDCNFGEWEAGYRERLEFVFAAPSGFFSSGTDLTDSDPVLSGNSQNPLLTTNFTLDNFRRVIEQREFWEVLKVTIYYTVFGTLGALFLGLFAALLLNQSFRGRTLLRGLFLFPYVSPVIAVAFTWVFFLDPFSGVLNALGAHYGVIDGPVNFLGTRAIPIEFLGLTSRVPAGPGHRHHLRGVALFPALVPVHPWARLQALPSDLYEAAEMDGATPMQKFRFITLPQLVGIFSILFMLRFIWTFNKFDDIFLMTGGAAGTRTLTVNVYEQGFALSNLGAGSAASVVTFFVLSIFMVFYFIFMPQEETS